MSSGFPTGILGKITKAIPGEILGKISGGIT